MKIIIALSIVVYFILFIILVLNITDKSKIIKYSFVIFMISLIIYLFFVNELIMDYIISIIIRYLYFPTFSSILATIMISIFIFLYNIFREEKADKERILNYIFASLILIAYVIFTFLNIDINSYNSLYSDNSLLCLRYISRCFTIWMIFLLIIKYFKYFIKREDKHD